MQREFWIERWQKNLIGFHRDDVNPRLRTFWSSLGLAPGSQVFVPLCGKSRDLVWLAAQGHRVLGVELSPIAVRDFFAEQSLTPVVDRDGAFERWSAGEITLLCGDFFDLTGEMLCDCAGVYDRASLIAMPEAMRPRYVSHLQSIVPPTAAVLLVTMEYPEGQMTGPPFVVRESEVRACYGERYDVERLLDADVLANEPAMRGRGLTELREMVFRLKPRTNR